jgi:hypothetical protein
VSRRRHPHDRLADAVRRLALPRAASRGLPPRPPAHDLAGRFDRLERELSELRGRITALFLAVIAVALGEVVSRVVGG